MVFSFFTKQKQDETLTLLVDIGSASVGCALVKIGVDKIPHILVTVREDIAFQDELSSARFMLAMNHALDRVLKIMHTKVKATGVPAHIFCTLSSPWFILKNRNINIKKQETFEVTERVLEEFFNEDIEKLKNELKETLPPKDIRIVEKKIVQMKLNGYDIKNPYGHKTSQMEIVMTVGISSDKVVRSIERKLSNFFHTSSVHFGAFPLAAFSTVRDIFPSENNFTFLDITGEATDVSIINNDIITNTLSFSCGKNFLIREISTGTSTTHQEASSCLNMFLSGTLTDAYHCDIKDILESSKNKWLARFEKALTSLSKTGTIPNKIFFTADSDIADLFLKTIEKTKKEFCVNGDFDIKYLDKFIVSKFVSFEAGVIRDPFIAIEALFVTKILSSQKK